MTFRALTNPLTASRHVRGVQTPGVTGPKHIWAQSRHKPSPPARQSERLTLQCAAAIGVRVRIPCLLSTATAAALRVLRFLSMKRQENELQKSLSCLGFRVSVSEEEKQPSLKPTFWKTSPLQSLADAEKHAHDPKRELFLGTEASQSE